MKYSTLVMDSVDILDAEFTKNFHFDKPISPLELT